jgi:hypothetical protein
MDSERKRGGDKIIQNQQRLFIARKSQILRLPLRRPSNRRIFRYIFGTSVETGGRLVGKKVCSREDGRERATETICLAHVLPCYRSHMVLSKEVLNDMTVAPANGGTVVQIHVSQRQSGALEWSHHTQ